MSVRRRLSLTAALLVMVIGIVGCSRPPWPAEDGAADHVLHRLRTRKEAINSATYRVRWDAKGTEPHGQFILEIAYQAPGRFRITATGPFSGKKTDFCRQGPGKKSLRVP